MENAANSPIQAVYSAIDAKFGKDIVVLKVSEISVLADYFIIATAGNPAQLRAMADAAEEALSKHNVYLRHSEGYNTSKWVLLDFGDIIAHLFLAEDREFYNLERVWGDAEKITF
ncbi:ribosomal silencing factor RsfS [Clostridia bacterium]|nr:ribosomal silencing factor RsfS [Clostridia bacterium]